MKKLSVLIFGLMASGMASAVQLTVSGDVQTIAPCDTLLNENVRINLTTNVVAGVACNATRIAIATCHIAGRQAGRSAQNTTCTAGDPDAVPPVAPVCTTTTSTVTGPAMANATSQRGTVVTSFPGGQCTAVAAETFAGTQ